MRRLIRIALGGMALALAAGVAAAALNSLASRASMHEAGSLETLGHYGSVPDFSLVERSGRRVTLADLRGRVWLANFIYTECTESCPLQSLQVSRLAAEFAAAPDLRFVSITVDPDHDTAAVLAAYARRYHADRERWLFLTGSKQAIYALAKDGFKLGVTDAGNAQVGRLLAPVTPSPAFASHGSKGLVMHSSRFVLIDRKADIRAYHRSDDPESLARLRGNLRGLLAER
jgi:cytochrome oxidase Cu insertion factor (SCO1/SenC/PrrC family)